MWVPETLLFLWLCFQICYCSLDPNQVCLNPVNDSSFLECHYYDWASFSKMIPESIRGVVVMANPETACSKVKSQGSYNSSGYSGKWFLLIDPDGCEDDSKALRAREAGFDAAIIIARNIIDGDVGQSGAEEGVSIPAVYVSKDTGKQLKVEDFEKNRNMRILITAQRYVLDYKFYMIPFAIIVGICFILMAMFMISRYYRHYLEQRRNRLSPTNLRKIPTKKFRKGDDYYDVCAICLEEYKDGERLRILPCEHAYHCKCVDPWLTEGKRTCPVCKRPVLNDRRSRKQACDTDVEAHPAQTNNDADERTPLISSTSANVASSSSLAV